MHPQFAKTVANRLNIAEQTQLHLVHLQDDPGSGSHLSQIVEPNGVRASSTSICIFADVVIHLRHTTLYPKGYILQSAHLRNTAAMLL